MEIINHNGTLHDFRASCVGLAKYDMLLPPFHPPSGDLFAMHGKEKAEGGNKAGESVGCVFPGMWHVFHCDLKKCWWLFTKSACLMSVTYK